MRFFQGGRFVESRAGRGVSLTGKLATPPLGRPRWVGLPPRSKRLKQPDAHGKRESMLGPVSGQPPYGMRRSEIECPEWALIGEELKLRRRLLQDQFGQLKLNWHRIVTGEAGVAEPTIGAADHFHQSFDVQVA